MLPRPPEDLVKKIVAILCKIVGISFIVFGAIFLALGFIILFTQGENSKLIGSVFIGGSILQIVIGLIVVRFMQRFLMGISESFYDK